VIDRRFKQREIRGVAMSVEERLERIEQMLATLIQKQTIKEWYTTAEVGGILRAKSSHLPEEMLNMPANTWLSRMA
jgi:hypothetical protein